MGLFSGGFGSGLVEGLAEGVDQSLKNAMEKRDKELSRARTFWETRQAQKMDLADAHDERASDALDKLIKEFKGDTAKGLAAYQAIGGNVDDVENYLAQVQDTRNKLGSYDITDKLNLDGIDLSQFADLSREQAFSSIRKEVGGVNVQMEDSGLLSKIGFGKDLGAEVSADVNELMPARKFDEITEFAAATLDRSGLVGTQEYAAQLARDALAGRPLYDYNITQLSSGKLSPEEEDRIRDENAAILLSTKLFEQAKDTSTSSNFTTLTELTSQYKSWRTDRENEIGYVAGKPGQAAIVDSPIMEDGSIGPQLTGSAAVEYRNKHIAKGQVGWITSNLLDENGEAVNVDAQAMITGHDFRDMVKGIQADIASAAEAEEEAATTPGVGEGSLDAAQQSAIPELPKSITEMTFEETGFSDPSKIAANPQDFIDFSIADFERGNTNVTRENITSALGQAGVPLDQIRTLVDEAMVRINKIQEDEAARQAGLDAIASGVVNNNTGNVGKRPSPNMLGGDIAGRKWDEQYGQTHDPETGDPLVN